MDRLGLWGTDSIGHCRVKPSHDGVELNLDLHF